MTATVHGTFVDGRPSCAERPHISGFAQVTGQRAGLTLDEIKTLLSASPDDHDATDRLREVASRKLPEIIALIERSELVRGWLECAARWECPDLDDCPLFEDPPLKPLDDSNHGHRRQLARGRTGHREHRIR